MKERLYEMKKEIFEIVEETLSNSYNNCNLCPRRCGVNRKEGDKGYCRNTSSIRVASANIHKGEEPEITGFGGSGTIFFSGCTLACDFCQNFPISAYNNGNEISETNLVFKMKSLEKRGAHNLNCVTPTHFAPSIIKAYMESLKQGVNIPLVFNTSGYKDVQQIKLYKDLVDIWLYDIKYGDDILASRYSHADNYVRNNKDSFEYLIGEGGYSKTIYKEITMNGDVLKGSSDNANSLGAEDNYNMENTNNDRDKLINKGVEHLFSESEISISDTDIVDGKASGREYFVRDTDGIFRTDIMLHGIIVRHLVLPGHVENTMKVIDYLASVDKNIRFAIMNQYFPAYKTTSPDYHGGRTGMGRTLSPKIYDKCVNYALKKGLSNILIQE